MNQVSVKSLGAGGEIIYQDALFYLSACVYLDQDDANEVLNSISPSFKDCGILTLKKKKVSGGKKLKIVENVYAYKFFQFLYSFINDFCEVQFNYLSGKITQKDLVSFLLKSKLSLEEIIENFSYNEGENLFKQVEVTQNLCSLYLNEFFRSFFESQQKNSLVCGLLINITVACCDLYQNL